MLTNQNKRECARLIYFSFANKFDWIISDTDLWLNILANTNYNNCNLTLYQNKVVAVCGYYYNNTSFLNLAPQYITNLRPKTPKEICNRLSLLSTSITNDTFYIEVLAVDVYHRQKGLASNLLKQTCDYAKSLDYTKVALDVASNNKNAINLYQKNGFVLNNTNPTPKEFKQYQNTLRLIKQI